MSKLFNHTRLGLIAVGILALSAAATVVITRQGHVLAGVYFG